MVVFLAMAGDGFSSEESSSEDEAPPMEWEWQTYMQDSNYNIVPVADNEGRHNVAVGAHKDAEKKLFAKVETVEGDTKVVTRCLDSWQSIGKISHCVQLHSFKLTDNNTHVVLIMEKAPGVAMSSVIGTYLKSIAVPYYSDNQRAYPSLERKGRTKLEYYGRLRLEACTRVYTNTTFFQTDWKADNMFYDESTHSVTLIDMPFTTIEVGAGWTDPYYFFSLPATLNWWTDDHRWARAFEFRNDDLRISKAFVNSWMMRKMSLDEIQQSRRYSPIQALALFDRMMPDYLAFNWPAFNPQTSSEIRAAYSKAASHAFGEYRAIAQKADRVRRAANEASNTVHAKAIEVATAARARLLDNASRIKGAALREYNDTAVKMGAVQGTTDVNEDDFASTVDELNYGRPRQPFADLTALSL